MENAVTVTISDDYSFAAANMRMGHGRARTFRTMRRITATSAPVQPMDKESENMFQKLKKHRFLFEELVKRDFKAKYKRTVLGMAWSVLSPLLTLFVMKIVFTQFFGRNAPHYTIYLFSGNIVMAFFKEATKTGMGSLMNNAKLISKVDIPKPLLLLSRNISALINFGLTLVVYFFFCWMDGITFGWHMLSLVFPIICLTVMNIGVGMILSAMYVFFRDTQYLYDVFLTLLTYLSAIFYQIDRYSPTVQRLFLCNPVYCNIKYFRLVTIDGTIPSLAYHLLCAFYALAALGIGVWIYRKNNHKFLYYM